MYVFFNDHRCACKIFKTLSVATHSGLPVPGLFPPRLGASKSSSVCTPFGVSMPMSSLLHLTFLMSLPGCSVLLSVLSSKVDTAQTRRRCSAPGGHSRRYDSAGKGNSLGRFRAGGSRTRTTEVARFGVGDVTAEDWTWSVNKRLLDQPHSLVHSPSC